MSPNENFYSSNIRDIPSVIRTPISAPTPSLQVYQRLEHRSSEVRDGIDPPTSSPAPTAPLVTSHELDLPIALQKDSWHHHPNPKYACVLNYDCLSTSYVYFVSNLDYVYIPKSTGEVMTDPNWRQVMVEEMIALPSNNT